MQIARTVAEARAAVGALRAHGHNIGLVPTMGALHEGHLSLLRAARAHCGAVVASLFVNPKQFAPNEDFARYPRTFDADLDMLRSEKVHLLFAPPTEEMYPAGETTIVEVEQICSRLDGAFRPGHFRGVATVVAKLFNIVLPDLAFFGQKDAAQVAILRRMVRDLNFDLQIVVCPTVREPDGLAMSSRNRYLSPEDRQRALVLSRALRYIEQAVAEEVFDSASLIATGLRVLANQPSARLDYLRVVNPDTLEDIKDVRKGALVAVAARIGLARLIDNILISPR